MFLLCLNRIGEGLRKSESQTIVMKTLRLLLFLLLCKTMLECLPITVSASEIKISVVVDGTELDFDVPPAVVNQRTMVPMRYIFEFLGAKVEWIPEESGIRATTESLDIYMQLGNPRMEINGDVYTLDAPPFAVDGRTLVPLRAVAEAFAAKVGWVQETTTVVIETPEGKYSRALDCTLKEDVDPFHLRTTNGDIEYFDLSLKNNQLEVVCFTTNPKMQKFAIRINQGEPMNPTDVKTGKEIATSVNLNKLNIPDSAVIEIYTKDDDETSYWSYISRSLYIEKINGIYQFEASRMWDHNCLILDDWIDPKTYLPKDDDIPDAVVALSDTICNGITDEYEKLLTIHDWVAENLYYDMDNYYNTGSHSYAGTDDLLTGKLSACQGYADLLTLLVQAQNIPCRQISGYALGISAAGHWTDDNVGRTRSNHAWNQAYVNHRWINIDATWDSDNIYENGEYSYGGIDYHLYFDTSHRFLSYSHKMLAVS